MLAYGDQQNSNARHLCTLKILQNFEGQKVRGSRLSQRKHI